MLRPVLSALVLGMRPAAVRTPTQPPLHPDSNPRFPVHFRKGSGGLSAQSQYLEERERSPKCPKLLDCALTPELGECGSQRTVPWQTNRGGSWLQEGALLVSCQMLNPDVEEIYFRHLRDLQSLRFRLCTNTSFFILCSLPVFFGSFCDPPFFPTGSYSRSFIDHYIKP